MTKAGLWMGYNWYGFSWDICEIYKDLYLGFILGIYTYNATKTWDIIHFNSWSIFGSPQKMVIFCYQSKVGDEWPSKSNVGLSRSQEPFNHLQCPRSHSKCLVVKWGYKWINPTYPIYNWGYNPLTKWDEPPSRIQMENLATRSCEDAIQKRYLFSLVMFTSLDIFVETTPFKKRRAFERDRLIIRNTGWWF